MKNKIVKAGLVALAVTITGISITTFVKAKSNLLNNNETTAIYLSETINSNSDIEKKIIELITISSKTYDGTPKADIIYNDGKIESININGIEVGLKAYFVIKVGEKDNFDYKVERNGQCHYYKYSSDVLSYNDENHRILIEFDINGTKSYRTLISKGAAITTANDIKNLNNYKILDKDYDTNANATITYEGNKLSVESYFVVEDETAENCYNIGNHNYVKNSNVICSDNGKVSNQDVILIVKKSNLSRTLIKDIQNKYEVGYDDKDNIIILIPKKAKIQPYKFEDINPNDYYDEIYYGQENNLVENNKFKNNDENIELKFKIDDGKLVISKIIINGNEFDYNDYKNYEFNIPDIECELEWYILGENDIANVVADYKQSTIVENEYYYNKLIFSAPTGYKISDSVYGEYSSDMTYNMSDIKKSSEPLYYYLKNDNNGAIGKVEINYQDIENKIVEDFNNNILEEAFLILDDSEPKINCIFKDGNSNDILQINGEYWFNKSNGTISVSATANTNVIVTNIIVYYLKTQGVQYTFKDELNINTLKLDGDYKIQVYAKDNIGNFVIFEECFSIDRTADKAVIEEINSAYKDDSGNIWLGKNQEDDNLTINFSDSGSGVSEVKVYDNKNLIYTAASEEIKLGSLNKVVSEFPEGEHSIIITMTDIAGNPSESDEYKFTIDRTADKAAIEKINSAYKDDSGNIWLGKDQEDDNLTVKFSDSGSGVSVIKIYDNKNLIYTAKSKEVQSESLSKKISEFSEGKHSIYVVMIDNVGNESISDIYNFIVDKTAEKAIINEISTAYKDDKGNIWCGYNQEDDNLTITFFDSDAGVRKIEIYNDDILLSEIKDEEIKDGKWSKSISEIDDNEYNITVVMTDNVGNTSVSTPYKFIVSRTANAPEIVMPSPDYKTKEYVWYGQDIINSKIEINVPNIIGAGVKSICINSEEDNKKEDEFDIIDLNIETNKIKDGKVSIKFSGNNDGSNKVIYSEGKHTLKVTITDNTGNVSEVSQEIFIVDYTIEKPNIEMPKEEYKNDDNIWYGKSNESINITFKDGGLESKLRSGLKEVKVMDKDIDITSMGKLDKISDFEWIWTCKLSNFDDGEHTIVAEIIDNVNNKEESKQVYNIDKTNPEIKGFSISVDNNKIDISEFIEELEYGYYFKQKLKVNVIVEDSGKTSGLNQVEYRLVPYNNSVKGEEIYGTTNILKGDTSGNGIAEIDIPANFKGQIYAKVYDNVVNVSEEVTPQAMVIDTPEKHKLETHIYITSNNNTNYKDIEGNPLYTNNVTITTTIQDTVSGIKEISYELSSENESVSRKVITINNIGYSLGQNLGDGWVITKMDRNLVTEVQKIYTFANDDNSIKLSFDVTDRAGNKSNLSSQKITIDKTAPIINVEFNNPKGNSKYYSDIRTAKITVIERNFDANKIISNISNTIGSVPKISFTQISNNQYEANLIFEEGNYTFNISGTDMGNQRAIVNYSGNNTNDFVVDLTDPIENDNLNTFINEYNNTFSETKIMTMSIKEHNFDSSLVNVVVYKVPAGETLTSSNVTVIPTTLNWSNNGDNHTTTISFTDDAVYQIIISVSDLSGRTIDRKTSEIFEIDKTIPILSNNSVKNGERTIYSDDRMENLNPIIFDDVNISKIDYKINIYQVLTDNDGLGFAMYTDMVSGTIDGDTITLPEKYFEKDGIYEVKAVAYDIVGNISEETVHTYAILRKSKCLVYIPNSDVEKCTGLYAFNRIGKRASDIDDINFVMYILDGSSYKIRVQNNELNNGYYTINNENSNQVNQVKIIDLTVDKSYFSTNYGYSDCNELLSLDVVVDSDAINIGYVSIDNVKPSGSFDTYIQNSKWYSGYYNVSEQEIVIQGISRDIDISNCKVIDYDTDVDFKYDENARTISFVLKDGKHSVSVKLVDTAGNENILDTVTVYVGSFFGRWWIIIVLAAIIIATGVTITIIKVRKKN